MHSTGCLGLVHWDDPEGGEGREEGGGFRMGNVGIPEYSGRWLIEDPAVMYVGEYFPYVLL